MFHRFARYPGVEENDFVVVSGMGNELDSLVETPDEPRRSNGGGSVATTSSTTAATSAFSFSSIATGSSAGLGKATSCASS